MWDTEVCHRMSVFDNLGGILGYNNILLCLKWIFAQQQGKAFFTFIHTPEFTPTYYPAVHCLPCRGSPHEVSFSWSEPSLKQKERVNGGRGSCFVTALSAMMQLIIKMQIERRQGVSLHLVFTLLQHSQGRPISAGINASKPVNQFSYEALKSISDLGYTKFVQATA